jgi:glycosyltransferase involved in cell wall biosynthesis
LNEINETPCLTIVIPAYNEGETIGITLSQLLQALKKQPYSYEIIVVDDGSRDGTGIIVMDIARKFGAARALKLITSPRNVGKGSAIVSGLAYASGSIIILMDADGAYNPEDIPQLISPILQGKADVVIGSTSPERLTPLRRLRNYIISIGNRLLLGIKIGNVWSGFKAFKAHELKELMLSQFRTGNEFDLGMIYFANKKGYRMIEMPLRTRLRKSVGHSVTKLQPHSWEKLRLFWRMLKLRRG